MLVVACGTSFSASAPDGGAPSEGGLGQDSAATKESGSPEAGGSETGGADTGVVETGGSEGGGAETGSVEAGGADTAPPVEAGGPGTYCGPGLVCTGTGGQQGTVCCVADQNTPSYQCASADCGCDTQLDCSSDDDCPASRCCIDKQTDVGCSSGHYVASCRLACLTAAHMCNPAKQQPQCQAAQSCSTDTSGVALPAGAGFGVCN